MRKYHRHLIVDSLDTLVEAVNQLPKLKNKGTQLNLCADIQDFVEAIKGKVDAFSGKETQTSGLLEQFLELLYRFTQVEVSIDNLKRAAYDIKSKANKELIADKIEMVFLAYNASMSDALLTLYQTAKDDPQVDAYWIPIPYYNLQNYGRSGEMQIETDGYKGIECIDWRKYDIEANHPEVIFTYNGYDDGNLVTQVYSNFWCKNLKDKTDCLVYIPYFITGTDLSHDELALVSGVVYSHLVVVENEQVRSRYLAAFKKNAPQLYASCQKKIIALGSPKYDILVEYAALAKSGELEIPADWREKIYKADGMRKKVIFYNTSLAALLADINVETKEVGNRYLAKCEAVLAAFEHRDDVVLLWRPHPLMIQTLKSMRPGLLEQWLRIIETYKRGGYGIYDDSGDLHRAIAVSDCYYGDGSSVAHLFAVCGKKVYPQIIGGMQQDELLPSNELYAVDLLGANGKLYAVNNRGHLFASNKSENVFDFVSAPTAASISLYYGFFNVEIKEDKFWFFPHNDSRIAVYDPSAKTYSFLALDLKEAYTVSFDGNPHNFFHGIFYKNKVFLQPCNYRNIVAYSLNTQETEHCLDLRELFPKDKVLSLFYGWEWLNETTVLFAGMHANEILEFNLETYEYRIYKLGRADRPFHSIFKYGDNFFLVGSEPFVLRWTYSTGEATYYDKMPNGFKTKKKQDGLWHSKSTAFYKNKIILFGSTANMAIEFNLDTCEFRKLDCFDRLINAKASHQSHEDLNFCNCSFLNNGDLYFICRHETLYKFDIENETIEKVFEVRTRFQQEQITKLNDEFIDTMVSSESAEMCEKKYEPCVDRILGYVKRLVM